MVLIQLSWGRLKAQCGCKSPPVLVELANPTLRYLAASSSNDYPASHDLRRVVSTAPVWWAFQENMAAMLWTGAEGVVSRLLKANVFVRDGWMAVAHKPAYNTLPQAKQRKVSLPLFLLHRQPLHGQTEWESQTFLIIHQVRMSHGGWAVLRVRKRRNWGEHLVERTVGRRRKEEEKYNHFSLL